MQQIPEKIDSKFRFVLLAAHRAEQLMRGASSKTEGVDSKPTRAAMKEILSESVGWEYGPEEVPETEDPLLGDDAAAEASDG